MARISLEEALAAAEEQPPQDGLRIVAAVRARLEALEALHVEKALRAGWSWRRMAEALGVTKQAVHKKHARRLAGKLGDEKPREPTKLVVTGRARLSVRYAREEARALGAAAVCREHLLLGLLRDEESGAATVAREAGITLPAARAAIGAAPADEQAPRGGEPLPIGAEARGTLEESLREAVRRGDDHLGVEHLLLALLHDADGPALAVLATLGVDPDEVERRLGKALDAA